MFLFATSQAIAASQAKQGRGAHVANQQRGAARPGTSKGFFARLLDAFAQSRMQQAQIELARQRRLREGAPKR